MMKNRFFLFLFCVGLVMIWASTTLAQGLTSVGSFTYVSRVKNEQDVLQYAYHGWMNNESQLILARFDGEVVGDSKVLKSITVSKHDIKGNVTTYTTNQVPEITNPSTDPTSFTYRYWWGVIGIVGAGKKNVVLQFYNSVGAEHILVSYEMKGGQLIEVGRLPFVEQTLGDTATTLKRAVLYKESVYVVINEETVEDGTTVSSEITQWDIKFSKIKKRTTSPHGEDLQYRHSDANLPIMLPIGYWYEDYEVVNVDGTWTRNIYIYKY